MKITDAVPIYSASLLKKIRKTGGAGEASFGDFLSEAEAPEETSAPAAAFPVAEMTGVSPLLALQEVSEEEGRRQHSLQQGRQSLDMLDALRRDMLMGASNPATLARLKHQAEQIRTHAAPDPRLQEIMNDIELRLAVEAAKLERIDLSS
jgi:hypothetical protein